jgi:ribosome-binding protein aMBF1 (putative translation factor)
MRNIPFRDNPVQGFIKGAVTYGRPMSKSENFTINRKISELLASKRKASGITQAELAVKIKKPQSFVSKYENGQKKLIVAEFVQICKALGLNPSDFLKQYEKSL